MEKSEIAKILHEISVLLDIKGENPFKVRAYENAARLIESLVGDLGELIESNELINLKGIGEGLAKHIEEIYRTGKLKEYDDLMKSIPSGLLDMLNLQGLGPKKIKILWKDLGIDSIEKLEDACKKGFLREVRGFGEKTEQNILKAIEAARTFAGKFLYPEAAGIAMLLVQKIKSLKSTKKAEVAGSIRRRKEIIGDIDILVATTKAEETMNFFASLPQVKQVLAHGQTKTSVMLQNGINADLRAIDEKQFPFALHYFTGSKDHNVAMRSLAKRFGMKLNEYGLFKGEDLVPCKSEEEIFAKLKLSFIPPELREGSGEIEAAANHNIPKLIEEKDIKGVVHVHSNYSDGTNSIEELAAAAKKLGYSYLGLTDHSESASYAGGLKIAELKKQWAEIDALNAKERNFRILKGIEIEIHDDGSLDYPDDFLDKFDFVIAAVHSKFNMSEDGMTKRICKALEHPAVSILAHPTGRLLLSRDPYPVNMEQVIECAAKNHKAIEINSHPKRLDLDWRYLRRAKEEGVKIVICPDAHSIDGFSDIAYGVGIARKGWLTKEDILNCETADAFLKRLRNK